MSCYADTGFLVSLHTTDANTAAARARMKRHGLPMAWTWLHDLEFRNAIRLQVFRGQIASASMDDILYKQARGLDSDVYFHATPVLAEVSRQAERFSRLHTTTLGARSLDILHVAQALVLGVRDFLTFDKRQAALARKAGLRVPKL